MEILYMTEYKNQGMKRKKNGYSFVITGCHPERSRRATSFFTEF